MGKRLPSVLLLGALFSGCEGDGTLETVDPATLSATPTYERDIAPLLERACVACHDSHGLIAGGVELDTYQGAFGSRAKSVCTAISPDFVGAFAEHLLPYLGDPPAREATPCGDWEINSMPLGAKSRLSRSEQLLLLRWLATGAPR